MAQSKPPVRDRLDPKGLIAEAYRIEGITTAECRSIFLDWALSLAADADMKRCLATLLERHGVDDHPMTAVLQEGVSETTLPRRRGGWRSRKRPLPQ